MRRRMEELAKELDRLNYEYYMNDRSLVSDEEFDAMMRELQELERSTASRCCRWGTPIR